MINNSCVEENKRFEIDGEKMACSSMNDDGKLTNSNSTVASSATKNSSPTGTCHASGTGDVMSATELGIWVRRDGRPVVVVDCRPQDIYKKGHMIGAENVLSPPSLLFHRLKGKPDFWAGIRKRLIIPDNAGTPTSPIIVIDDDQNDNCACDTGRHSSPRQGNGAAALSFSAFLLSKFRDEGFTTFQLERGGMARFLAEYKDLCAFEENSEHEMNEEGRKCPSINVHGDGDSSGCPCRVGTGGEWALSARQSPTPSPSTPFLPPLLKFKDLTLSRDSECSGSPKRRSFDDCRPTSNGGEFAGKDSAALDGSAMKSANDGDPVNIISTLYLGNADNAADLDTLRRYNIKYILNVTSDLPNPFENKPTDCPDGSFKYLRIPIVDNVSQNLGAYFPVANQFIDEAIEKKCGILVHCLAGISRSVTFTVAYLMKSQSYGMDEAYDLVKKRKPNIESNLNFMRQLLDYERTLSGSSSDVASGDMTPDSAVSSLSTSSSSIYVDLVMNPGQEKERPSTCQLVS